MLPRLLAERRLCLLEPKLGRESSLLGDFCCSTLLVSGLARCFGGDALAVGFGARLQLKIEFNSIK